MVTVFMVCAVVGSIVVVVQFVMTLMGFGHDLDGGEAHMDFDHGGGEVAGGEHFEHGGNEFFTFLSFRALVAAVAVFGLAGLASNTAGNSRPITILIAVAGGAAALFIVGWAMRLLYSMKDDGTVHIERAVGQHGTVYLTIPGERTGAGKVFLNLQDRTVECQAVTARGNLPAGSQVVVVEVLGPNTVEVEPLSEK